jgi:hypothetical protein
MPPTFVATLQASQGKDCGRVRRRAAASHLVDAGPNAVGYWDVNNPAVPACASQRPAKVRTHTKPCKARHESDSHTLEHCRGRSWADDARRHKQWAAGLGIFSFLRTDLQRRCGPVQRERVGAWAASQDDGMDCVGQDVRGECHVTCEQRTTRVPSAPAALVGGRLADRMHQEHIHIVSSTHGALAIQAVPHFQPQQGG